MKKKQFFLFLLVLPLLSFVSVHKFYVSVTEMEYKEEKKSLQIITRIFTDDLENVLQARYSKEIFLTQEKEHPDAEAYLERYLKQKFSINVNGKLQEFKYLGKEYENDMVLLYIEAQNVPRIKKIEVHNSLLQDFFSDQKNIVHVEVNKNTKSLLLTTGNEDGSIEF